MEKSVSVKSAVRPVVIITREGEVSVDYTAVHESLDQSKVAMADVRHRALLHHTLGTRLAKQCLGDSR